MRPQGCRAPEQHRTSGRRHRLRDRRRRMVSRADPLRVRHHRGQARRGRPRTDGGRRGGRGEASRPLVQGHEQPGAHRDSGHDDGVLLHGGPRGRRQDPDPGRGGPHQMGAHLPGMRVRVRMPSRELRRDHIHILQGGMRGRRRRQGGRHPRPQDNRLQGDRRGVRLHQGHHHRMQVEEANG